MESYWDRLKPELEAQGKGITDLAAALGVSFQAVAKVRDGGSFGSANNFKAAKALGLSPEWLASGKGPKRPDAGTTGAPRVESPPATYRVTETGSDHTIPQYADGGAMGNGLVLEHQPPGVIKSWRVDPDWLRLNVPIHTGVHNLCIVTGFGPSMKPLYNPGDPLLMDRGVRSVETEGVFFFRLADHGYIKQLQRIPTENGLVLRAKSLNVTFDPFDITAKMQELDFECFGKILTVWKSEQV